MGWGGVGLGWGRASTTPVIHPSARCPHTTYVEVYLVPFDSIYFSDGLSNSSRARRNIPDQRKIKIKIKHSISIVEGHTLRRFFSFSISLHIRKKKKRGCPGMEGKTRSTRHIDGPLFLEVFTGHDPARRSGQRGLKKSRIESGRVMQAALQTATAVVSSCELVSCGNGGDSYAVVARIPAAT